MRFCDMMPHYVDPTDAGSQNNSGKFRNRFATLTLPGYNELRETPMTKRAYVD
jgi:hypothetical protein